MRLLHPGRGDVWWWTPDGLAWTGHGRLWMNKPAGVESQPVDGPVQLHCDGDRVLAVPALGGGSSRLRPGLDLVVKRPAGSGWQAPGLVLPEGAERAVDLRPFPVGVGVIWVSGEWIYRLAEGRLPEPAIRKGEEMLLGPHGAILVAEGGWYTRAAGPRRPPVVLEVPLREDPWGVRWSADGLFVRGVDADSRAVRIAMSDGRIEHVVPDSLPVDDDDRHLHEPTGVLWNGDQPVATGLREASWDLRGAVLGGPGGVAWDLATGTRLFSEPVFLLGATVATDGDWLTVDWDSGEGRWVDVKTGVVTGQFQLDLADEEVVIGGVADGGAVVVVSSEERAWRVGRDGVGAAEVVDVVDRDEGEAEVNGVRYLWDTDGRLEAS